MNSFNPDLTVDRVSNSLKGVSLDLVVSGSIGSVESVRFIRSLRRLGAMVRVILTSGAKLFTTKEALEWASDNEVIENFSGAAPHIATSDFLIVAPASASIIGKIASGICDSPATTLIQSYLGMNKTVMLLPNMHTSLSSSPFVEENLKKISKYITVLSPRKEEGKFKFPEPKVLADEVSHLYCSSLKDQSKSNVLVCMGSTKGYLDDIRYVSNYSSGSLGSHISEELYRSGFNVYIVTGNATIKPSVYSKLVSAETNETMEKACNDVLESSGLKVHVIMLASVLDYVPKEKQDGKLRSGSSSLNVELIPTEKIISKLNPCDGFTKVGFKLEPNLDLNSAEKIASDYTKKYSLSGMVLNSFEDVSPSNHRAFIFTNGSYASTGTSKQEIASSIKDHVVEFSK